jgi:hypothetical protein
MNTLCAPPAPGARVHKPHVPSAAERTGWLFDGYHLLEQTDQNAPRFDGPRLRRVGVGGIPHLAVIGATTTLCGSHSVAGRQETGTGRACEACRLDASRIRGVIVK